MEFICITESPDVFITVGVNCSHPATFQFTLTPLRLVRTKPLNNLCFSFSPWEDAMVTENTQEALSLTSCSCFLCFYDNKTITKVTWV